MENINTKRRQFVRNMTLWYWVWFNFKIWNPDKWGMDLVNCMIDGGIVYVQAGAVHQPEHEPAPHRDHGHPQHADWKLRPPVLNHQ